ncbi:hypothetical protein GCM10025868_15220 [Angustibacter aerolatus]|uniref:TatD family hydrolase n=1 Tax=Angustibacter aerolatus TaxID=1162965 RepID=A0ABQ6JER4_9ACTN|nr:TatD family hydrolase [Angustibacter aerolatus]GMA86272.1 hypothetical protein GCM10025868_15220 [Angustibacter aerolatus]
MVDDEPGSAGRARAVSGGSERGTRPPSPDPLPLPVVDDHTHLDIPGSARGAEAEGEPSVTDLLERAAAVNVPRAVQIGCDLPGARQTIEPGRSAPAACSAGSPCTPTRRRGWRRSGRLDEALAEIEALAAHPRVRVVGETGLDFFRTGPDGVAAQEASFRAHIDLAKRLDLTLQIHDRDAHDDVLRVLEEEGAPPRTVFHCFSGDAVMARRCVDAGYVLSFAGTVTFKNAQPLRDALAVTPLDQAAGRDRRAVPDAGAAPRPGQRRLPGAADRAGDGADARRRRPHPVHAGSPTRPIGCTDPGRSATPPRRAAS